MRINFTKSAIKELRKIGPKAANIRAKIDQYANDPASLANNVEALQGCPGYRLRVGGHRVLFEINGDVMLVTAVRKRGEAYD